MPLIFELTDLKLNFDIKTIVPYYTVVIAFLLVSKLPTLSLKKISISPKSTVFILLGIGMSFISFLYYTFETLLAFGLLYLASVPASFFIYQKQSKKEISEILDEDHEDVL